MTGLIKLGGVIVCGARQEVPGCPDPKHTEAIGTASGKWNRGSPRVPVKPFVSRVESGAGTKEGTVTWDKRKGREGVWLRDKPWCTMEVLIFDRSYDLPKLLRGLGLRLPKGLPSPCLLHALSCSSVFLSPTCWTCLSLSVPLSPSCFHLAALSSSHCCTQIEIWQWGLVIRDGTVPFCFPDSDTLTRELYNTRYLHCD